MRILVVDVNTEYRNTMYRLFYNSIPLVAKVQFYGPGYVSRECLAEGIDAYLKQTEEFDAIMLGINFVYSCVRSGNPLRNNCFGVHRNTLPYYNVFDSSQFCREDLKRILHFKHKCKILFYYDDPYTLPYKDYLLLEKLVQKDFYVMSWPFEMLQEYSRQTLSKYKQMTNYAYTFAETYKNKYLPIPCTAIQANELFFGDLSNRDYDFNVPGNLATDRYPERAKMRERLSGEQSGARLWNYNPYAKLSPIQIARENLNWYEFQKPADKFLSFLLGKTKTIYAKPKMEYIAANREVYLESLRNSKCAFVDGGIGIFLVRKYFETCSCGALLIAADAAGLSSMGFEHNKNMLLYHKIKAEELQKSMQTDLSYYQEIADEGRKLIMDKHLFYHRVRNLEQTIQAVCNNQFQGAWWKSGEYHLI